jgi:hypothetical protein
MTAKDSDFFVETANEFLDRYEPDIYTTPKKQTKLLRKQQDVCSATSIHLKMVKIARPLILIPLVQVGGTGGDHLGMVLPFWDRLRMPAREQNMQ